MCGRFQQSSKLENIRARFHAEFPEFSEPVAWRPHYNVAPTQTIHAIRINEAGKREICDLVWGLVPGWVDQLGKMPAPINARDDGIAFKPMFRNAFKSRRCIIPADGFYEWQKIGKAKQPFHISTTDGLFPLAGIWERRERDGKALESVAIVTTAPNPLMAKVHDRMPLILDDEDIDVWMKGDAKAATKLLKPFPAERMTMYPVSTYVGNVKNQGEKCIEPATLDDAG